MKFLILMSDDGDYLIDVASRADAEHWAARLRFIAGANEVREVWE